MKYHLYLASGSLSRKLLLEDSQIPFSIISQTADESQCSLDQSLEKLVRELAYLKMNHIVLPQGKEGQIAFFVTADTMTIDLDNKLHGKPTNREDAKRMLRACRDGAIVGTAFCLERKIFKNNSWIFQKRIVDYDQAWCRVDISDIFLDFYLDHVPFTQVSGGITIEKFGEQFVKEIKGNYSAILGMPMYKLREALYQLGFYDK